MSNEGKAKTRGTINFTTKGKNKFTLQEYLNAREKRAIKNALWEGKSLMLKDGKGETDKVPMDQMDASTDMTIKLIITEMNGSNEDILDRVLDLPSQEYDELLEKIEELTGDADKEKKDSGSDNTETS